MGTSGEGEATGGRAVSTQGEVLGTQHLKPKVQTPYVGKFVPSHRVFRCRVGDTSPGVSGLWATDAGSGAREVRTCLSARQMRRRLRGSFGRGAAHASFATMWSRRF